MPRKFEEICVGDVKGDMQVIGSFRDFRNKRRILHCRCSVCGRKIDIYEGNFRDKLGYTSHTIACGKQNPKFYDIWEHVKEFYDIWEDMKDRIYNPRNKDYSCYGGRGLTTDYDDFVEFYDEQYMRYVSAKQNNPEIEISMDLMDNNLGYVRGNISWTPRTSNNV